MIDTSRVQLDTVVAGISQRLAERRKRQNDALELRLMRHRARGANRLLLYLASTWQWKHPTI